MEYFPVFFKIENKPCLIVGGGDVALRKAETMLKAGACLTVVSPVISLEIKTLLLNTNSKLYEREYVSSDVEGVSLIIAATDILSINQKVAADATKKNIPVNVVDNPALCTFIFPAIVDRSPMTVAISSSGKAPVLARMLRTYLETQLPTAYGRLAELVGKFRDEVKAKFPDIEKRRHFWESVLSGTVAEHMYTGRDAEAKKLLKKLLMSKVDERFGEVYLVGAGPGDPDLLTFRALRLMQQADVVLYDRLVAKELVDLTRRDAKKIYVGKQQSDHPVPQQEIHNLMISLAKEGKRVLRLKGGDPFIFGRGGEEITELAEQGIPFQVVPGITSAGGCASYAGIPLTHRDYAQSVIFVTGHMKDGNCDLVWSDLIRENQTVVIFMGLSSLELICAQLLSHGVKPDKPIALIQQGTTAHQKVVVGEIQTIVKQLKASPLSAPTLIIIGDVVKLHSKLSWFQAN